MTIKFKGRQPTQTSHRIPNGTSFRQPKQFQLKRIIDGHKIPQIKKFPKFFFITKMENYRLQILI